MPQRAVATEASEQTEGGDPGEEKSSLFPKSVLKAAARARGSLGTRAS